MSRIGTKRVKVQIELPSDLLSYCYKRCNNCKPDILSCLAEISIMRYLHLGRCKQFGHLVHESDHACQFFELKEGNEDD